MGKRIFSILILISFLLVSCVDSHRSMKEVVFVMDTIVTLDVRDHANEKLLRKMTDRLMEIDSLMSFSKEESDIYQVNHAKGESVLVDSSTYYVVKKAVEYTQMSGGCFDPSIGRLVALWGIGTDDEHVPSFKEIEEAVETIGSDKIFLSDPNSISLMDGTMIDVGAIAKGFAADEMIRIAKEAGVKSAIFNLGGNISVLGSKGSDSFRIGIRNPFSESDEYFGIVEVTDTSVVTSGNYERYFIDESGVKYHHILDPFSGYPADNELSGVTVICSSSIKADAFSTALYVMGLEKGLAFIEQMEDMEAIFVTNSRDVYLSTGLQTSFLLCDDSFRILE